MAVTQVNYTGNGSTTNYSFTFPYLAETDIKVSLGGVITTNWSLHNATTVRFSAPSGGATDYQEAGGAPKSSVVTRIYRDTDDEALRATFYPGSAIRANDLNENGIILLHDCLPNNYYEQAIPRCQYNWNGDVWKAIIECRTKEDIDTFTINADFGLGVIMNRKNSKKRR